MVYNNRLTSNRSMRSDIVTIEPEVVQFGRQSQQTIKIINNTGAPIANFFFCLYNTEKFTFAPDSFSLAPHQHRLVTITLRLKAARSAAKQFAYLKSSEINRRITLLVNSFNSPDPKPRQEEGVEDANTLSSREYNEVQNEAIQRIIREKQAYIQLLERERDANRQLNFRTEESAEKGGLRREVEQMEMRLILAENEKQSILRENLVLQEKFEEYRKYCEADLKNYQKVRIQMSQHSNEIIKLQEQIQFLQDQGTQYIKKLEEKQAKIRQLQVQNKRTVEQQKRQAQKRMGQLQTRLQQQKRSYNDTSRQSQDRIRDLQWKLQTSQKYKLKYAELQRELKRKEDEVRSLSQAIESQRSTLRELEGEKKKLIKYEVINESMSEKNNQLSSRVKELEKVNHNLREEVFVYRNKMAQHDLSNDKMAQYYDTSLQACKNENETLKRTKINLQKDIDDLMAINRQAQDHNKALTEQLTKYKEQSGLLADIKENLEKKCEELKQEHHLALMRLKTENIELLQKLSCGEATRREEKIGQLEDSLHRMEEELVFKARELERCRVDLDQQTAKNDGLIEQNARLAEKVRRYKKQARKELRSINDTAVSQLNKTHQQNRQMAAQISQLQAVIAHYDCQRLKQEKQRQVEHRAKSGGKSAGKSNNNKSGEKKLTDESQLRKERTSSRVIGIKDQRKQIQQSSKAYSQTSHNNQHIFSELGQLRQLNNYIRNEQERLSRLLQLDSSLQLEESLAKVDERPVFRAIRFFKKIQGRVREMKGESQLSNAKEVEFLKGRIRQLEALKDQNANLSNVSLSKTREQLGDLLEYVREEMRSQYKKLNDHIKLNEQKHELLKRKIYEEYRAKIIEALGKKEKGNLQQLQLTLERFIDAMSNLSHKQAVLHKEVKLKQHARKQNIELKEKVTSLNHLLQTKKGYCTRDPLKLLYSQAEQQWQDSLKREAQLLTLSAQYQRLKQEFDFLSQQLAQAKMNNARMEKQVDERSAQVLRLKRYQIQIQTNYQNQMQKQHQIIEENKRRIMQFTRTGKQPKPSKDKEREYIALKENYDKQKDVIRILRQKEKMLDDMLQQSHRTEEKQRKKANEQSRVVESMRDLRDNNRQLRTQNAKLKEKNTKLQEQLQKKTTYLKNLKGDMQENRIRVQRKEEGEAERLREQSKRLTQELKRARDQLQKAKKRRQKEAAQHKNQVDRLANQNLINVKSLESIVRALMDNLRDIYGRLRYYIKKRKGVELDDRHDLFDTSKTVNIDGLKINEAFERALTAIETSN